MYRDGSTVRLESDNDNYEPIIVHADDVQLVGLVVGVLRQL
jgi:SOS-response transcriptional repressor LexA